MKKPPKKLGRPIENTADERQVDESERLYDELEHSYSNQTYAFSLAYGAHLFQTYYGNDLASAKSRRPHKGASLRVLQARLANKVSLGKLNEMLRIAIQDRELRAHGETEVWLSEDNQSLVQGLNYSHLVQILRLKAVSDKIAWLRKVTTGKWSVSALKEMLDAALPGKSDKVDVELPELTQATIYQIQGELQQVATVTSQRLADIIVLPDPTRRTYMENLDKAITTLGAILTDIKRAAKTLETLHTTVDTERAVFLEPPEAVQTSEHSGGDVALEATEVTEEETAGVTEEEPAEQDEKSALPEFSRTEGGEMETNEEVEGTAQDKTEEEENENG